MAELKPCPFCGGKLMHIRGKRVNRYYNGEPTMYEHPPRQSCLLGRYGKTIRVYETDVEAWNRRAGDGNDYYKKQSSCTTPDGKEWFASGGG